MLIYRAYLKVKFCFIWVCSIVRLLEPMKKYFSVCLYITGTGNQTAVSTVSAAFYNSKYILKLLNIIFMVNLFLSDVSDVDVTNSRDAVDAYVNLHNNWHYATARNPIRSPTSDSPPISATKGIKPPKLKFLLRFYQNSEHQCTNVQRRISCEIFTKFAEFVPRFRWRQTVKISIHLLKSRAYRGMRVLSWRGLVPPKFSASHSGETMRRTPTILEEKNVLKVVNHRATFGGARISPAARATKNVEFLFVRLSVCSSRFWTSEVVRPLSPWRRWSTETILMTLDKGRGRYVVLVVHQCSNFSDCSQLATLLNAEFQKRQKLGFFAARGRQNKPISRRNFTRKRIPGLL